MFLKLPTHLPWCSFQQYNCLDFLHSSEKQSKVKQELLLGERTTLDLLDGEQELLKSQLDLVVSKRDLFVSYYEILFYLGKLNAKNLKLDVELFDEKENYNKVKYKWLDLVE